MVLYSVHALRINVLCMSPYLVTTPFVFLQGNGCTLVYGRFCFDGFLIAMFCCFIEHI